MRRLITIAVLALATLGVASAAVAASREVRVPVGVPLEPALAWGGSAGPHGARATGAYVAPDDPEALRVAVPVDGQGTYRLAWSVLSVDGHPYAGTRAVVVGAALPVAVPVAPRGSDGIGPLGVIARLLVLAGMLGTLGLAATRAWVLGGAWRAGGIAPPAAGGADDLRERSAAAALGPVRSWWRAWWSLKAAWGAGLVLALIAQPIALGIGWREVGTLLVDTRWGLAWIVVAALSVATDLIAVAVRRGERSIDPGGARMALLAAPAAIAALVVAWSGHAGTGSDATLGTAFDALHAWATAVWLGGLLMLAVLAVPLLRALGDGDRVRLGAGVVVRFSSLAVIAVVLLVVTGVYRALAELPDFAALWTTSYGVTLLVKLAIFAAMLVLAAWNRFTLHPRLERAALGIGHDGAGALGALRASIRAEVVLAVAVLAAVAVLVSIPPPL